VTADEIARLIDDPELRANVSALELTEALLARIDAAGEINAFITVTAEQARADARRVDDALARGESPGPLAGMPMALKDNIDMAGAPATAGSDWFRDRVPDHDAEVVRALRAAGAVIVGKVTLHELAYGATTANPHFGACRNPWDLARVPGGSSGGSGAAVASDLCIAALGTDTGGSVRIPGALNGVTGLRPSYGSVSNRGVLPISASLDTVGPLARSVLDVARVAAVISGYDPHDPYAIEPPAGAAMALEPGERLDGVRIGVAEDFFFDGIEPGVERNTRAAAEVLDELGAELRQIEVADAEQAMEDCSTLIRAEALALHRERLDQAPWRFGEDVRKRLELGRSASGAEVAASLDSMRRWHARMLAVFESVDLILTPTTPDAAPLIDEVETISSTARLTRFCYPWSLAWLPAISLPSGLDERGLPTGTQLAAAPWREGLALRAGVAFQRVTDFHRARPPVAAG
jgi:aspartyl-tRNA(Asn)/glutamyl-tRNA(Gln) amidotransferase subunit A